MRAVEQRTARRTVGIVFVFCLCQVDARTRRCPSIADKSVAGEDDIGYVLRRRHMTAKESSVNGKKDCRVPEVVLVTPAPCDWCAAVAPAER